MKVLFIHQSFPGQFGQLSANLARDKKNRVVALAMDKNPAPAGVEMRHYSLLRRPVPEAHPLLRDEESKVLRAEACAAAAMQLKHEGFEPDVIIAHPGWGEALFMKDVFPQAKLVIYCEYYYAIEGQDVGFDPEDPPLNFEHRCALRLKNATNLLSMEIADAAISPTQWQRSTYPAWAQERISVIHDGIDFDRVKPDPKAAMTLQTKEGVVKVKAGDEVLTYVSRNLEPIRGFHILMRTLPEVLKRRPKARVLIAGGDDRGYGYAAPGGGTWRDRMLAEVGKDLDLSRVHFLGKVPYQAYLGMLNTSRVHAYWTSPFVLSWSYLEAAASGLKVIASDTPPVREFSDRLGTNTVGFFDKAAYADAIVEGLSRKPAARKPVKLQDVELQHCLKLQKKLIADVL
ncbi:MAG TPA: glycosyltransferase [Ramlibacter sp.]|nr:glycosyltransferase [Ramlibacter sp.]